MDMLPFIIEEIREKGKRKDVIAHIDNVFSAKFPCGERNYAAVRHSEIFRCAKSEIALRAADGAGSAGKS